jgi:ureidoacrylate peracid hydrolase
MTSDTAVIMIDMQNTYLADDGVRDALGWPPIWRLHEVVAECAALLDEARRLGVPVIYSYGVPSDTGAAGTPANFAKLMEHMKGKLPELTPEQDAWSREIMDAVAPKAGDIVMGKTRPSFFEYTELEPLLHNLGVKKLIIAGLQTNVCVEATTRSALARNFDVGIPEDAVSTDGPDLHWAALNSMRVLYAEVAPWRALLAPGAAWDTRFTTPDYGRNAEYWSVLTR